jgi:hypothetical protein
MLTLGQAYLVACDKYLCFAPLLGQRAIEKTIRKQVMEKVDALKTLFRNLIDGASIL